MEERNYRNPQKDIQTLSKLKPCAESLPKLELKNKKKKRSTSTSKRTTKSVLNKIKSALYFHPPKLINYNYPVQNLCQNQKQSNYSNPREKLKSILIKTKNKLHCLQKNLQTKTRNKKKKRKKERRGGRNLEKRLGRRVELARRRKKRPARKREFRKSSWPSRGGCRCVCPPY